MGAKIKLAHVPFFRFLIGLKTFYDSYFELLTNQETGDRLSLSDFHFQFFVRFHLNWLTYISRTKLTFFVKLRRLTEFNFLSYLGFK